MFLNMVNDYPFGLTNVRKKVSCWAKKPVVSDKANCTRFTASSENELFKTLP